MGKKGKGRQSGDFGSKSLKANHHQEVRMLRDETLKWTRRETAGFVAWSNAHERQQRRLRGERPTFALALRRNLNGVLHERQAMRSHQFRERRRRNGFLPSDEAEVISTFDKIHEEHVSNGLTHPPGWLLRYKNDGSNDADDVCKDEMIIKDKESLGAYKRRPIPSLQSLALAVFANHIRDYRSAMGDEELYGALSILPPEAITELSIRLSSTTTSSNVNSNQKATTERGGERRRRLNQDRNIHTPPILYMDDDFALLLGQHQHVERLCFRSRFSTSTRRSTITNVGLEALIPRNPVWFEGRHRRRRKNHVEDNDTNNKVADDESSSCANDGVLDSWEDDSESSSSDHEPFDIEREGNPLSDLAQLISGSSGCNLRLRRLELLDLSAVDNSIDVHVDDHGNSSTTSILLRWFETCSGITHLSLAGSFRVHHEVGRTILLSLPRVLPNLEVLDVTRCPWATDSLLARMLNGYLRNHLQRVDQNDTNRNNFESDDGMKNRSSDLSLLDLLPTVYYYQGRFDWQPENFYNAVEMDLWDDNESE